MRFVIARPVKQAVAIRFSCDGGYGFPRKMPPNGGILARNDRVCTHVQLAILSFYQRFLDF